MSKRKIIIIIGSLIILSAAGYFLSTLNLKKSGPSLNQTGKPAATGTEKALVPGQSATVLTPEQVKQNQTATPELIKKGDVDQCAGLDGNFKLVCQYNILTNQAVSSGDASVCGQINDEIYKKSCTDLVAANKKPDVITNVTQEEAAKTEAEKNKATILNGAVYKNLITADKEGKMTESIFNEYIKLVAYADQPELCWEIPQNLRQECLERVYILQAKKADDTKICDKIPTSAWKDECLAEVLTRRAAEKNDSSICKQIANSANQTKCLSNF